MKANSVQRYLVESHKSHWILRPTLNPGRWDVGEQTFEQYVTSVVDSNKKWRIGLTRYILDGFINHNLLWGIKNASPGFVKYIKFICPDYKRRKSVFEFKRLLIEEWRKYRIFMVPDNILDRSSEDEEATSSDKIMSESTSKRGLAGSLERPTE